MENSLLKQLKDKKKGCGTKGVQGVFVATCGVELYCPSCQQKINEAEKILREVLE